MMFGVIVTLAGACRANARAGFEQQADEGNVASHLPRQDARRELAHFGAVFIQANTAPQHVEVLLTKARVGARRTDGRTFDASVDAFVKSARRRDGSVPR
jgi:hypothetical protein